MHNITDCVYYILTDQSMMKIVHKWKSKLMNTKMIVCETTSDFINDCHIDECDLGNLITDSYIYYVSIYGLIIFPTMNAVFKLLNIY